MNVDVEFDLIAFGGGVDIVEALLASCDFHWRVFGWSVVMAGFESIDGVLVTAFIRLCFGIV
jgi:hypothetical protein